VSEKAPGTATGCGIGQGTGKREKGRVESELSGIGTGIVLFISKSRSSHLWEHMVRRVFHPTPPFAALLGFHLLIFSHTRLEAVDDRYGYGNIFSPNCSISSLRCTRLIFRFVWRLLICHCSSLENAHHCASQPCKEQRWRNKPLSSCL
jgi:hypothetical protein